MKLNVNKHVVITRRVNFTIPISEVHDILRLKYPVLPDENAPAGSVAVSLVNVEDGSLSLVLSWEEVEE